MILFCIYPDLISFGNSLMFRAAGKIFYTLGTWNLLFSRIAGKRYGHILCMVISSKILGVEFHEEDEELELELDDENDPVE